MVGRHRQDGVIFTVQSNGAGYHKLHTFQDGSNDGALPLGSLIQDGSYLCGMTCSGGSAGAGVVFSMRTDGGAFNVLCPSGGRV
jgi:hypothetical protein